jgi:glutathione peroxidase
MYTDQYRQLQEIFELYGDRIVVVGFPSNDFGEQEPGNNREIKNFCSYKYGVTFPLASKSSVIGADANPVFRWLADQAAALNKSKEITWNFQKYLLDESGRLLDVFSPAADPINEVIMEQIGVNSPTDK